MRAFATHCINLNLIEILYVTSQNVYDSGV